MKKKKYFLSDEITSKRVVVTTVDKGVPSQEVIILSQGMSDKQIRQAVQKGVHISHFDGDVEDLKRYEINQSEQRRLLSGQKPRVKTKLVFLDGSDYTGVQKKKAEVVVNPAVFKYELITKGLSFNQAEKAFSMSLDELKEGNFYKEVGKAMGMKGNFGAQSVFDKMRG